MALRTPTICRALFLVCTLACTDAHGMFSCQDAWKALGQAFQGPRIKLWSIQDWYSSRRVEIRSARRNFSGRPQIKQIDRLENLVAAAETSGDARFLQKAAHSIISNTALLSDSSLKSTLREIGTVLNSSGALPKNWGSYVQKLLRPLDLPEIHTEAALAKFLFSIGEPESDVVNLASQLNEAPGKYVIYKSRHRQLRCTPVDGYVPDSEAKLLGLYSPRGARANQLLKWYDALTQRFSRGLPTKSPKSDSETNEQELEEVLIEHGAKAMQKEPTKASERLRREFVEAHFGDDTDFNLLDAKETISPGGEPEWFIPISGGRGRKGISFPIKEFNLALLYTANFELDERPGLRNRTVLAVLRYYSEAHPDEGVRETASVFITFQRELMKHGYYIHVEPSETGGFEIGSDAPGPKRIIKSHTKGPFSFDRGWVTQWSGFPPEVRDAFIKSFPADWFAKSAASRVLRTLEENPIKTMGQPGYRVGSKFIPFVADWLLLPHELQALTNAKLTAEQRRAWKYLVDQYLQAQ
jgi:hypothetical protein